ncbi:MAG: hypothetical protein M1596_02905 [Firmicutes bacterium]|nr:hypothetical protein [Bacillota bacterium]
MRRMPLRQKASRRDAQVGQVLWRKDHGGWGAVTVTAVVPSPKGLKVHYRDVDGQPGKCLLDALYRPIK